MLRHIGGNRGCMSILSNIDEEMIQQHAVDVRVAKIYALSGTFSINGENRHHREKIEIIPKDGYWHLEPGVYNFDTMHEVEMAEGEAGFLLGRSTYNRNGILINSSLYDSGFKGGVNGMIYNLAGPASIAVGERIAQFIITDAETIKLYDGVYNAK